MYARMDSACFMRRLVSTFSSFLRSPGQGGWAIMEVLIAGVVLSVAALGLALMFSFGQAWVKSEGGERVALYLAQQKLDQMRSMGLANATTQAETSVPGFSGWLWSVSVSTSSDADGSGALVQVIRVIVRSTSRQAGPITVTTVYMPH